MNAWKAMVWIGACVGLAALGLAIVACNGTDDGELVLADGTMVVVGNSDTALASGILSSTGLVQAVVTLSGAAPLPNMGVGLLIGSTVGFSTGNGTLTVTQAGNAGDTWTLRIVPDPPPSNYVASYVVTLSL